MAVGKNKPLMKGGKKGAKKKVVDPFYKKRLIMIEAHVDVKTIDGYLLRLFCVGLTNKHKNQIQKTSHAQHQQVRQIRKKMMEIMTCEVQKNDSKEVVTKLIPDSTGKDKEKACQSIYSLHEVFVIKENAEEAQV
ncbi:40S ribosomal protein S3a [Tupaia chinensis]|uniref:40S ribosomal protein S3a n=1 Tax=Tupaia chinensis TaxID=246437 RepID=L9L723_TUPCH|nr:40S ribosomal protein S3a [Tupaia chinensis]